MSSIVRRMLQRFMKPTCFVGRDLEGNRYYEYPNANNDRSKRIVQYKRSDDMWTYVASGKRLPVQWNAWLTHTRPDPPSIEELRADLARQHLVQMNAALIEARDKERARVAHLAQPAHLHSQISEPRAEMEVEKRRNEPPPINARLDSIPTPVRDRDPWMEAKKGSDEPESWTPVVRRK